MYMEISVHGKVPLPGTKSSQSISGKITWRAAAQGKSTAGSHPAGEVGGLVNAAGLNALPPGYCDPER